MVPAQVSGCHLAVQVHLTSRCMTATVASTLESRNSAESQWEPDHPDASFLNGETNRVGMQWVWDLEDDLGKLETLHCCDCRLTACTRRGESSLDNDVHDDLSEDEDTDDSDGPESDSDPESHGDEVDNEDLGAKKAARKQSWKSWSRTRGTILLGSPTEFLPLLLFVCLLCHRVSCGRHGVAKADIRSEADVRYSCHSMSRYQHERSHL